MKLPSILVSESIEKDSRSCIASLWSLKYELDVENLFNSMLLKGNLRQLPF